MLFNSSEYEDVTLNKKPSYEELENRIKELDKIAAAHRKIEEELRLQSEIITNMAEGVYLIRLKDATIIYANPKFEIMFGYGPGEMAGRHVSTVNAPTDKTPEETAAEIMKTLNETGEWHGEVNNKKKDGTLFWSYANISAFDHSKYGKVLVAVHNDITEIKLAGKKLKTTEDRYREVVENTDNLVTQVDMDGKFLYINATAREILGISPDRLIGMSAFDFIHPEDTKKTVAWFDDCLKQRISQSTIENRQINRTTGDISHMLWTSSFIYNDKGTPTGISSIAHNITHQKKLEEEQFRKLESVATLAGGIAHDFNNLLGIITGNIDMALDDIHSDAPAKFFLENAFNASLQGRDLTKKFLIFSKGGNPAKEKTSLRELLINTTSLSLSGSNIAVDFSIPENLWLVESDPDQINQVFNNLTLNAKEAMPQGGTLRVFAENLEELEADEQLPVYDTKKRFVKISFRDIGSGIQDGVLPRIFDPYFSTKEKSSEKGTGLGLTIVNSIIQKHGGTLNVLSEEGLGTTFEIFLPASLQQMIPETEKSKQSDIASKKILFMDDEKLIREMVREMLVRLGCDVVLASHGEEAVSLYNSSLKKNLKFDAVILDLTIKGGMGGEDTIRKLLEIDPDVNAIVCSGYSDSPVISNYKISGFKNFLKKPFVKKDLLEVLKNVFSPGKR